MQQVIEEGNDEMIYDRILVRYGELSIKGKNRKYFKNALHKIIRRKLRGLKYGHKSFHHFLPR